MSGLTYVGRGRFIVGIPATSLSPAQIAGYARARGTTPGALRERLIASGLYAVKRSERK